tara:strand:- start:991 stop:1347 length:357 start_codon:yes stop_codon:yes gene_type:complete
MKLRLCYLFLLLATIPATSQSLRVASFHISQFTQESDIERIADIVQQYGMVAIQDLRDLAAADTLLIASGTLPAAQASMELVEAYQNVRDSLLDEPTPVHIAANADRTILYPRGTRRD